MNSQEARIAGDNECRAGHQLVVWGRAGAFAINEGDILYDSSPDASDILYREGSPNLRLEHHISDETNLRDLSLMHSLARVACVDPSSLSFKFAGAATGPQHEFRVMYAYGDSECPSVDTNFQEWTLPPRKVQRKGCHDWGMGLRLGLPYRERSEYQQRALCGRLSPGYA